MSARRLGKIEKAHSGPQSTPSGSDPAVLREGFASFGEDQNAFVLRTVLKIPTLESTKPVTVSLRPPPATQLRLLGLTGEPLAVEWMRTSTKPQRQPPGGRDPPAATDACGMGDCIRTQFCIDLLVLECILLIRCAMS